VAPVSDLLVEVHAFEGTSAALVKAAESANSAGSTPSGDFGHPALLQACGLVNLAWAVHGATLHANLEEDGQQVRRAGAEFTRVDNLLSEQAKIGKA
jgi:hypothetical protein